MSKVKLDFSEAIGKEKYLINVNPFIPLANVH